ncbi:MAG TPA: aminodeoxychorismate/anthranilate synthase component II [Planctomycetes bacterium]|nr:aminodeoxychorismate/anthranilate synthase component II [Planctomycetota bacterium]
MKPRTLIVDHVDSFTFNIAQALGSLGAEVLVRRSDELTLAGALALSPTHLVLSPGPGHPCEAGLARVLVRAFAARIPILGVCLGHQVLGLEAGGRIVPALHPEHGVGIRVFHDGTGPMRSLPNPFRAGRYHSLVVAEDGIGPDYLISAWSEEGEVLGIRHRELPIHGVQFHPESVLTPEGGRLFSNFLGLEGDRHGAAPREGVA